MDIFSEPILIGVAVVALFVVPKLIVKIFRLKGDEDFEFDDLKMLGDLGSKRPKSGVMMVGTIERVERTGISMDDDVRVYKLHMLATAEDGTEYRGAVTVPIEEQTLSIAKVGNILPVIVDPAKPSTMYLADNVNAEEFALLMHKIRIDRGLSEPLSPELERYGVTTQGVLSKVEPTGKVLHGELQVFLEVKITDATGSPVALSKTSFFTEQQLKNIHVGMVIPVVKYLPQDHSNFINYLPLHQ